MRTSELVPAEAVRDGIVVFDQDGVFVHANSAAAAISGWSEAREYQKLLGLSAGLVELRARKWVELRHVALPRPGQRVRAAIFGDVTAQLALRDAQRTCEKSDWSIRSPASPLSPSCETT